MTTPFDPSDAPTPADSIPEIPPTIPDTESPQTEITITKIKPIPPISRRYPVLHFAAMFYTALGWLLLFIVPASVITRMILHHESFTALQARIWNLNLVWFIIAVITSFALGEAARLLLELAKPNPGRDE